MSSASSILKGTLLLTGSSLFLRAISMLFQLYLSARIGAAGLGLLQLISSVAILAMNFGSSGIRTAAIYLTAEEYGLRRSGGVRLVIRSCIRALLVFSVLAGAALILAASWIARSWIRDLQAAPSLRLIGLFLPITGLSAIMTGYFTACGKFSQMVRIEILEQLLCIAFTLLLLQYWAADRLSRVCCAIFLGSSISCTIGFLLMYRTYRRDCRHFAPAPKLPIGRRLFSLCLPLSLNGYLRSGLSTLENMLIPYGLQKSGTSFSQSMATYGIIHGMVFPLITFAMVLLFSLCDVLIPELARCSAQHNHRRVQNLAARCLSASLVFACAIAGLLFCNADLLAARLYQSPSVGVYLRILIPLLPVLYLDAVVDGMHKGLGEQVRCVRYNTLTSFLDVVLIFLLLPAYGIAGYLFSFALTHLLNFYLSLRRLLLVTGISPRLRRALLPVLSAALSLFLLARLWPAPGSLFPALLRSGLFLTLYSALLLLFDPQLWQRLCKIRALVPAFSSKKPKCSKQTA